MRSRFLILLLSFIVLIIINLTSCLTVSAFNSIHPQTNVTPISPVVVSTPNENGAIYHIVQYGQTLEMISIAYGISIQELRTLNNLSEGSSDIYIGQSLIIRIAQPPTETPTLTPTTPPPTRTPRSITPIVTSTPLPTTSATPRSLIPRGITVQRKSLGFFLLGIGVFGLLVLGINFILSRRNKP